MSHSLLGLAHELEQAGKPFVLATVVWCERPTSAKPGAQVIIDTDGQMTGWIGGSCAQPVVLREALRAMREGDEPYLLRLGTSETGIAHANVRTFPMTCSSGGVLDIYIEPHLPQPRLLLIGDSPIVVALQQLAPILNFAVTQLDPAELPQASIDTRTYIIVASHGAYDEDVLEHVLRSPAAYIGMVASHRRADSCRAILRDAGMSKEQLARLQAPAGLDVGAVTPAEIAASILAELIRVQRRHTQVIMTDDTLTGRDRLIASVPETDSAQPLKVEEATALDLVCGMMVDIANARHRSSYDGRDFYFCCPACKRLFERNPQEYLVKNER